MAEAETVVETLVTDLDRILHTRMLEGPHQYRSAVLTIATCLCGRDGKDRTDIPERMYTFLFK